MALVGEEKYRELHSLAATDNTDDPRFTELVGAPWQAVSGSSEFYMRAAVVAVLMTCCMALTNLLLGAVFVSRKLSTFSPETAAKVRAQLDQISFMEQMM